MVKFFKNIISKKTKKIKKSSKKKFRKTEKIKQIKINGVKIIIVTAIPTTTFYDVFSLYNFLTYKTKLNRSFNDVEMSEKIKAHILEKIINEQHLPHIILIGKVNNVLDVLKQIRDIPKVRFFVVYVSKEDINKVKELINVARRIKHCTILLNFKNRWKKEEMTKMLKKDIKPEDFDENTIKISFLDAISQMRVQEHLSIQTKIELTYFTRRSIEEYSSILFNDPKKLIKIIKKMKKEKKDAHFVDFGCGPKPDRLLELRKMFPDLAISGISLTFDNPEKYRKEKIKLLKGDALNETKKIKEIDIGMDVFGPTTYLYPEEKKIEFIKEVCKRLNKNGRFYAKIPFKEPSQQFKYVVVSKKFEEHLRKEIEKLAEKENKKFKIKITDNTLEINRIDKTLEDFKFKLF